MSLQHVGSESSRPEEFILSLAIAAIFLIGVFLMFPQPLAAKVTGDCVNCHTMHNSQGGATMNGQASPMVMLLKISCLGCHAMNTAQKIETLGGNNVPQVRHTDASGDLAGGNFAYMLGDKGSGASDAKGHNVVDFGNLEGTLTRPPGFVALSGHYDVVPASSLTCAASNGCHGKRPWGGGTGCDSCHIVTTGTPMKGTHHRDVDGQLDVADMDYNSYRFLWGVKGYEAPNWQNTNASNHNEYFGFVMPAGYTYNNCSSSDGCHDVVNETIYVPSHTMSGFCATCHGNFHQVSGIGGDTVAPFTRHPTDVLLPSTGEYAAYTAYSIAAPVARTTVPASPVSTVSPGTDVVMCLSCHVAHASDYDDLLRWDYSSIIAGGGSSSAGCFICHTTKDTGS